MFCACGAGEVWASTKGAMLRGLSVVPKSSVNRSTPARCGAEAEHWSRVNPLLGAESSGDRSEKVNPDWIYPTTTVGLTMTCGGVETNPYTGVVPPPWIAFASARRLVIRRMRPPT